MKGIPAKSNAANLTVENRSLRPLERHNPLPPEVRQEFEAGRRAPDASALLNTAQRALAERPSLV